VCPEFGMLSKYCSTTAAGVLFSLPPSSTIFRTLNSVKYNVHQVTVFWSVPFMLYVPRLAPVLDLESRMRTVCKTLNPASFQDGVGRTAETGTAEQIAGRSGGGSIFSSRCGPVAIRSCSKLYQVLKFLKPTVDDFR